MRVMFCGKQGVRVCPGLLWEPPFLGRGGLALEASRSAWLSQYLCGQNLLCPPHLMEEGGFSRHR